jgi:hypothetical protein
MPEMGLLEVACNESNAIPSRFFGNQLERTC